MEVAAHALASAHMQCSCERGAITMNAKAQDSMSLHCQHAKGNTGASMHAMAGMAGCHHLAGGAQLKRISVPGAHSDSKMLICGTLNIVEEFS